MRFLAIIAAALPLLATPAVSGDFFCPSNTNGYCAAPGSRVCGPDTQCVDKDAQCFAANTCDIRGFVCKSDMIEVIDAYNALQGDHDALTARYNLLARKNNDLRDCVNRAGSALEARACLSF
ncbi:hypothetical protein FJU08_09070 [Martelella alba]|uniref:Uncharacterized protein n=1 Tax=Martelella alba TaxID=2590451 RepID=A0A506UB93_9HYPH|nr:hypothetical protein [Martelella alba]TPW30818.1 hypothetical protein FJU08_09070 [Martelella alba]